MISQHWFRQWLGAIRQQAITWTNVDPDIFHHMASPGHNELKAMAEYVSSKSHQNVAVLDMFVTYVIHFMVNQHLIKINCLTAKKVVAEPSHDIKNNASVTVNNDFLVTSEVICQWFSRFVTSENHWKITSRVTKKSLFTVTNVLLYYMYWTHHSATNKHRSLISPLSLMTVFSDLTLWRHHSWSVMSR